MGGQVSARWDLLDSDLLCLFVFVPPSGQLIATASGMCRDVGDPGCSRTASTVREVVEIACFCWLGVICALICILLPPQLEADTGVGLWILWSFSCKRLVIRVDWAGACRVVRPVGVKSGANDGLATGAVTLWFDWLVGWSFVNDLVTGDSGQTPLSSDETLVGLSDSSRLFLRLARLFGLIHLKKRVTDCPNAAIGLMGGEVIGGGDNTGAWHVCSSLDQCASSTENIRNWWTTL